MYLNNLVVAIKHNGKVLREKGNQVILPFSSEYSIRVKNLNAKRVSVNISIDGDDVLDNKALLIEANSSVELDGFMDGMSAKNRFKFIKKTKQISDYRGDKVDDGLIRVEFAYERANTWFHCCELVKYSFPSSPCRDDWEGTRWDGNYSHNDSVFTGGNSEINGHGPIKYSNSNDFTERQGVTGGLGFSHRKYCLHNVVDISPNIDDGITVKGSEIKQDFVYGNIGTLEEPDVMIIHLCGEKVNGTVVSKPITVKTRLRCRTCGNLSKSNAKFCSNCGTFLE